MKTKVPGYTWINAVMFQAAWLTCILGNTQAAITATVIFMVLHLSIIPTAKAELRFVLPLAVAGYSFDYILYSLGVLDISPSGTSSVYLLCLWILFASTLNWSMSLFIQSRALSISLGLAAPLSYIAAQKLEKVKYSEPLFQSIALHALLWTILMLIVHYTVNKNEEHRINAG